jgi:sugar/nucleoside kinase (ribokinase family)
MQSGTVQLDEELIYQKFNHVAILIVNREEAAKIAGREALLDQGNGREVNKEIVKELAHILHSFGPDLVVITNGNEGSNVSSKSEVLYFAGILDDVVVERTGAGDAFSTGFLSQYISSADIPLSIKAGTINAGAVVGKIGAQAGLLTKEELESQLTVTGNRGTICMYIEQTRWIGAAKVV